MSVIERHSLTAGALSVSSFIAGFWRQNDWGFSGTQLQEYVGQAAKKR